MQTFGFYNRDLEINIKFKQLDAMFCSEFVAKYEDLPRREYILTVISAAIANIDSEVRPAIMGLDPMQANETLIALYNGCVMINPILDVNAWGEIITSFNPFLVDMTENYYPDPSDDEDESFNGEMSNKVKKSDKEADKRLVLHDAKLAALPRYMKDRIVGQDEAIDEIYRSLCRYQVGLNDFHRPIGVFILSGASGTGKTFTAKVLHDYLFSSEIPMVRIDCGEYQHKHENQKLGGSPAGYAGYEDGGFLSKAMKKTNGSTVVLLDEIEKAHPDFWDTMLKIFDDGYYTDAKGNNINFRNSIFILTSNLGNKKISETEFGKKTGFTADNLAFGVDSQVVPRRDLVVRETNDAINKYFKIEFMGRIDKVVVFNHLSSENFRTIADLELKKISDKLKVNNFDLKWTQSAADLLVTLSSRSLRGVRSMSEIRRSNVEDSIATMLLSQKHKKGTTFNLDAIDGEFILKRGKQ